MIRLVLFTIALISFTNVSYASFPVDNELTEISNQIHNIESNGKLNPLLYIIGVLVGILSCMIFPLNLLLLIFIKDRSFKTSFIIGLIIGIILLGLIILSAMTLGAAMGG